MKIITERNVEPRDALRFINAFKKDSFLEEMNPDLAKSVNDVYAVLSNKFASIEIESKKN